MPFHKRTNLQKGKKNPYIYPNVLQGEHYRVCGGAWGDLQGTHAFTTITLNCFLKQMSSVIQLYFATVRFASWARVEIL